MSLPMSKERKEEVIRSTQRFFAEKLEIELSELQAAFLVDYVFHEIAPFAYNQGVEDAQKHLVQLAEDLPGTCFQEPLTYWDAHDSSHVVRRKPEKT
jgi:uncharacterized protein (DUF2164 family)